MDELRPGDSQRQRCFDSHCTSDTGSGNLAINIILPLFAIMVAGYFTGRFKLLPAGASEVLSRFVFVIALPALILASLSSITIAEFFNWHYIGALGGGMLAMFCIAMIVARYLFPGSLTAISLHGLTAMYSSTGYIGLPLVLTVFGDAGRAPGIIGAIITGLVFAPLAIILAEIDRMARRAPWRPAPPRCASSKRSGRAIRTTETSSWNRIEALRIYFQATACSWGPRSWNAWELLSGTRFVSARLRSRLPEP